MKKLITIILALIMTLFSSTNQGADQSPVIAEKPPQTSITAQAEQVPEGSGKPAETAFVGELTEAETTTEVPKKEAPTFRNRLRKTALRLQKKALPNRKTKPSNASTKATKALRNTSHKLAVSRIPSRTPDRPRSMIDR